MHPRQTIVDRQEEAEYHFWVLESASCCQYYQPLTRTHACTCAHSLRWTKCIKRNKSRCLRKQQHNNRMCIFRLSQKWTRYHVVMVRCDALLGMKSLFVFSFTPPPWVYPRRAFKLRRTKMELGVQYCTDCLTHLSTHESCTCPKQVTITIVSIKCIFLTYITNKQILLVPFCRLIEREEKWKFRNNNFLQVRRMNKVHEHACACASIFQPPLVRSRRWPWNRIDQ